MSYAAVATFWLCILAGRLWGGSDWCPAWLSALIFVAMFLVHWKPANRFADWAVGKRREEGVDGR